jgi:hypothetical protein
MSDARRNAVAGSEANSGADEGWAQRRLASRQTVPAPSVAQTAGESEPSDDKRAAERRREERRTGPASGARVVLRGRNNEVKLLNLSGRGAMIGSALAAESGERIAIQFADCNPIHGSVRWARDGRIGIEFARQTALLVPAQWRFVAGRRNGETPTDSPQRPRPPRQPVLWECELYWGRGTEPARLRNISAEGAMIDAAKNIPIGTEVVLALRSAGTVSGVVKWCRSGQVGLKFERAFDLRKLLDPGKLAAGAASGRPGVLKPLYLESEMDPSSPWAGQKDKLRPQDFR